MRGLKTVPVRCGSSSKRIPFPNCAFATTVRASTKIASAKVLARGWLRRWRGKQTPILPSPLLLEAIQVYAFGSNESWLRVIEKTSDPDRRGRGADPRRLGI